MTNNDDREVVVIPISTRTPEKYVLFDMESGQRWTPTGPNHTWVAYTGDDAHTLMRKSLAKAWGYVLEGLLDETFEDGTPMLPYILKTNPELAKRLWRRTDESRLQGW